jgi:glycosyltransferase involved in cell wall biosynthesis
MELTKDQVTFVLPNYNHADYLKHSIGNILNQKVKAHELIIVDDASTDHSINVIKGFMKTKPQTKITLIQNKENLGCIQSLNKGLEKVTTEFVGFPGADDMLSLSFLENALPLLKANPKAAFSIGLSNTVDEHGRIIAQKPLFYPSYKESYFSPKIAEKLISEIDFFFLSQTALYRTKYFHHYGSFDKSFESYADGYHLKLLAINHGFCFIPKQLASWRQSGRNYSLESFQDDKAFSALLKKIEKASLATKHKIDFRHFQNFKKRMIFNYLTSALLAQKGTDTTKNIERIKNFTNSKIGDLSEKLSFLPNWLLRPISLIFIFCALKPYHLLKAGKYLFYRKICTIPS